ncbi:hypothetical protein PENTCL1PPCAC_7032, partial [Pristionchus entomophagus]
SFFLLIIITSLLVDCVSLGDTLSSLQHGTLRLTSDDRWSLDSSEESNEDEREAYLKQLKNLGRIHHQHGGLPE